MYEHLKGKRLLFLGGILRLRESVEIAKSMGIYTIVTDYYQSSPAKQVADKAYTVSTTDIDALVELCKQERVDGVFTCYMDSMLPYARQLCDRMGFPFYASNDQIKLSLDKAYFKQCCRDYSVAVPEDYVYDGSAFDKEPQFPVVVKPLDSSGGRGVTICYTMEELTSAYEKAMKISPKGKVLVEQYIEGEELTATYTIKNGEVSLSCLKDKLLSQDHNNITSQSDAMITPSKHLDRYLDTTNDSVIGFLKGMKATDGVVFFQGIAGKEQIVFFELGYRPSGACDYRHISRANGINFMKMMIAHSLTGEMQGYDLSLDNPYFPEYYMIFSVWAHGGTIGKMSGLEEIKKIPGVEVAEYHHIVGETVVENGTLEQKVFRCILKGKNMHTIRDIVREIQALLVVQDTTGKNLLYNHFDLARLDGYKTIEQ